MIYRMVMVVYGKVAIYTVSLASPPNGKVDGVLLRTVLHRRSSERFLRSNQDLLYRVACMLHDKQILRKNEVFSMKSNLRNEIKSYIVRYGYTMQMVSGKFSSGHRNDRNSPTVWGNCRKATKGERSAGPHGTLQPSGMKVS